MTVKSLWCIAAMAGSVSAAALADTDTKMSFTDVVKEADLGVVAKPVSSSTTSGPGGVKTLTVFEVETVAFGSAGDQITVETPGGEIPGALYAVAEVATNEFVFFANQSNLMMLESGEGGAYTLVGSGQGLFAVSERSGSRQIVLPENVGGVMDLASAVQVVTQRRDGDGSLLLEQ